MEKKTSSLQILDNKTNRKKRGPHNKISKQKRLGEVRNMYFEEGHSIVDIAKTLGIHRNTATSDVKYWIGQFEKHGIGDEVTQFFYKQKSLLDSQKIRLLKKLKTESDFDSQNKLEKLLFSLYDREMKFYQKFMPMINKPSKASKKLVKKIIRELAFAEFEFKHVSDLIKEIIQKTKCDLSIAHSIVDEMEKLGLDYATSYDGGAKSIINLAKMCGYLSDEEYSKIEQKISQREEQEEQELYQKRDKFDEEFKKNRGDPKNWSYGDWINYKREQPGSTDVFS